MKFQTFLSRIDLTNTDKNAEIDFPNFLKVSVENTKNKQTYCNCLVGDSLVRNPNYRQPRRTHNTDMQNHAGSDNFRCCCIPKDDCMSKLIYEKTLSQGVRKGNNRCQISTFCREFQKNVEEKSRHYIGLIRII